MKKSPMMPFIGGTHRPISPTPSSGEKKYSFIQAKGLSEEDVQYDDLNSYPKPSEKETLGGRK